MEIQILKKSLFLTLSSLILIFIILNLSDAQTQVQDQNEIQNIQNNGEELEKDCNGKVNCSDCIQSPKCGWCAQVGFTDSRCKYYESINHNRGKCLLEHFHYPINSFYINKNENLTKGDGQKGVQIQPQHILLKMRVGESHSFGMKYACDEFNALDLYYLMDLSNTMEDDQKIVSSLGQDLARAMKEITPDFQVGFGSFIDKVASPFVLMKESWLKNPCGGDNKTCASPYSFKHHLTLTKETDRFSQKVSSGEISKNFDKPEGGFDAIMQAIVCDQIGWRENSRRILLYSTDASFHFAGDGKLAGVIKPHDGQCHLNSLGEYMAYGEFDYPSIAQLNSKVAEKAVSIIFAVTESEIEDYKLLSIEIEGSSFSKLESNSSNIVELVEKAYKALSTTVEIKDTSIHPVKVRYFTKCFDGDVEKERNKCTDAPLGGTLDFRVQIEITECPKDPKDWQQIFKIYRVGLNESLTVDLQMNCGCACENKGNTGYDPNSKNCNSIGDSICGVCNCGSSYYGKHCECNGTESGNDELACTYNLNGQDTICSNRGNCECRQCKCAQRDDPTELISGNFCECDNYSCKRHNGVLCDGHGRCECGKCKCFTDYEGEDCSCSIDTSTCFEPGYTEPCHGFGDCVCGQCKCDEAHTGKYCQRCPTCPDRCEEIQKCVHCRKFNPISNNAPGEPGENEGFEDKCRKECEKFEGKESLDIEFGNIGERDETETVEDYCVAPIKDASGEKTDCQFHFIYGYKGGKLYVRVQEKKDCHSKPPIVWIIVGVVVCTVLTGLFLLGLYLIYDYFKVRREYSKFNKETQNPKFAKGENPLFKQATSNFSNPLYDSKYT